MNKILPFTIIVLFIIIAAFFIAPDLASAQPPPPPEKPEQNPIDGGLGILAVAGGAYAIKKLRNRKE